MNNFFSKNMERCLYVCLLISINSAYLFIKILTTFSFIFPKKNKGEIILFPYSQKGSDGYTRRFEEYFKFFNHDNIKYKVCDIFSNEYYIQCLDGNRSQQYRLYSKTIWIRIFQVLQAKNYKAVFIQRGLFPFYPDQKIPYLEKLLRKLNSNITIDFWDSVWIFNEDLVSSTVKFVDKICVANDYIMQYFINEKAEKFLFPIGINLDKYIIKEDYSDKEDFKLFYTGSPNNVKYFLNEIENILISIKKQFSIILIIVSRARFFLKDIDIEYYDFEEKSFFELLNNSDIGLYLVSDSEENRGKTAMKVFDYMAAGLPSIASPIGITSYACNNKNILFASTEEEWITSLKLLLSKVELRKSIGRNACATVHKYHNLTSSYKTFKNIIFSN